MCEFEFNLQYFFVMDHFLSEVFDVFYPKEIGDIETLFDTNEKLMVYQQIYKHPLIISNIIFSFCYEQCLGISPSKLEIRRFNIIHPLSNSSQEPIDKCDKNGSSNLEIYVARAMDFMAKNTFYRYIANLLPISAPDLLNRGLQFASYIKADPNFSVKAILEEKLKRRILPSVEIINLSNSTIDKNNEDVRRVDFDTSCQSKTLFAFYSEMIGLSGLSIPQFYEINREFIKKDELFTRNVFSNFILYPLSQEQKMLFQHCRLEKDGTIETDDKSSERSTLCISIMDCISFQINNDYCFLRLLMTKPVVANYGRGKELRDLASIAKRVLDKEKCDTYSSLFGVDLDLSAVCCHSQDDTKKPQYRYTSNASILNFCVPRILGMFIWISEDSYEMHPKSIFGQNMSILRTSSIMNMNQNMKARKSNFEYYQIVESSQQIRSSKFLMIPFLLRNEQDVKDDRDTHRYSHIHSHVHTQDILDLYIREKKSKTPKEKHILKSLVLARNYLMKYMAHNDISISRFRDEERERETVYMIDSVKRDPIRNCILYVDNRENIQGIHNIIITHTNLKKGEWNIVILTGSSEVKKDFYRDRLGSGIKFIDNELMDSPRFNIEHYNMIMKNEKTWDDMLELGFEKCLIIQDDSIILRKGMEDRFMQYDYVGPPWKNDEGNAALSHYVGSNLVGNGGISLRTIDMMSHICKTYRDEKNILFNQSLQTIPEDVYFSMMCQRSVGASVPGSDHASLFAIEQVYNKMAFGVHKFWVYNKQEDVVEYFMSVLEA